MERFLDEVLDLTNAFSQESSSSGSLFTKDFPSLQHESKWLGIAHLASSRLGIDVEYEREKTKLGYHRVVLTSPQDQEQRQRLLDEMQPELDRWLREALNAQATHHRVVEDADKARSTHMRVVDENFNAQVTQSAYDDEYVRKASEALRRDSATRDHRANVFDMDRERS